MQQVNKKIKNQEKTNIQQRTNNQQAKQIMWAELTIFGNNLKSKCTLSCKSLKEKIAFQWPKTWIEPTTTSKVSTFEFLNS